ncbi:MAG: response regulator [Anaerolineales bacterium]|nr:response regulator [Anaerolineales bacterium]
MSHHLFQWQMKATAVSSAAAALAALAQGDAFDVVLLDLQMPEMDGLMLAAEIRRRPSATAPHLLLLTSMDFDADQARSSGVAVSLRKPVKPALLREALLTLWQHSQTEAKETTGVQWDPQMAEKRAAAHSGCRRQPCQPKSHPDNVGASGLPRRSCQ